MRIAHIRLSSAADREVERRAKERGTTPRRIIEELVEVKKDD